MPQWSGCVHGAQLPPVWQYVPGPHAGLHAPEELDPPDDDDALELALDEEEDAEEEEVEEAAPDDDEEAAVDDELDSDEAALLEPEEEADEDKDEDDDDDDAEEDVEPEELLVEPVAPDEDDALEGATPLEEPLSAELTLVHEEAVHAPSWQLNPSPQSPSASQSFPQTSTPSSALLLQPPPATSRHRAPTARHARRPFQKVFMGAHLLNQMAKPSRFPAWGKNTGWGLEVGGCRRGVQRCRGR